MGVASAAASTPTETASRGTLRGRRVDATGLAFQGILLFCLVACFAFLVVLLQSVWNDGLPTLRDRGADFLTSGLSTSPRRAGVWQGIKGSLLLAAFVTVIAFPLGIATAVYLEEYAPDNRLTRLINLNIRNLAGVPSVVYGLLGLGVFVQLLGTDLGDSGGLTGGRSLLSGGLTLSILVLPVVIITSAEALRAVPRTLREGGYGLGSTRWDVTRTLVLPSAAPGILTGTVLALSRALGETAPLILVGAFFGNYFVTPNQSFSEMMRGDYTALPMIIYNWAGEAKASFKRELAPAAILVLLAVTLLCNALAVWLRQRYERDQG